MDHNPLFARNGIVTLVVVASQAARGVHCLELSDSLATVSVGRFARFATAAMVLLHPV